MRRWLLALAWPACTAAPPQAPSTDLRPMFDADALLADTATLLEVPRVLGAPDRTQGLASLALRLTQGGATAHVQSFTGFDPLDGSTMPLSNLFGVVRPDAPRQFVLATHFDVRPWAEADPNPNLRDQPIPGANDGTSGVVVLLALLPVLRDALPSDVGFTIVLFDGEELGRPKYGGYCAGSTYFSTHLQDAPPNVLRSSFGIVLDMVGDAELRIAREPNSTEQNPALVEAIWSAAASLGERSFIDATYPIPILDDHVLLSRAGIPSVLLIDYDYEPWHTHADTLDRVSGESLATVARVVTETVLAAMPPGAPAQ
ncbi:MAG: M28 family peptidase [Nannocystaceae bacterium]|nr:M28 family peptidase [Nannocystaceae bacterium]